MNIEDVIAELTFEIYTDEEIIGENLNPFFKKAEQDFRNGYIKLEEYTDIQDKYYKQSMEKVLSENAMAVAKINLEEIIGTRLEDVR